MAVLAALVGVGLLCFARKQSDEKRIAERIRSLAACVSKEAGEGNSVMILKTQRLGALLDDS